MRKIFFAAGLLILTAIAFHPGIAQISYPSWIQGLLMNVPSGGQILASAGSATVPLVSAAGATNAGFGIDNNNAAAVYGSGTVVGDFDVNAAHFTGREAIFSGMQSVGTQTIAGCSLTSAAGGTMAGSFHSGTTGTCTVTITPGFANTPNGYSCWANDLTTTTDHLYQTAVSTTTATIAGTTVSGDVITWGCLAY